MTKQKNAPSKPRGMRIDLFGIVLMIVALALGQFVASYLGGMFGLAGGIMGSLLTGAVVYAIYTVVSGGKFGVMNAVLFIVLVYVAQLAAAYVASAVGMASGWLTLILAGVIVSFVWGWIGGRGSRGKEPKLDGIKL